jgi:hypothetical protein
MLSGAFLFLIWPQAFSKLSVRQLILGAIAYILIGTLYSIIRWIISVRKTVSNNNEVLKKHKIKSLKELKSIQYKHNPNSNVKYGDEKYTEYTIYNEEMQRLQNIYALMSPQENKSKLIGYICYWPWNIVKFLLGDFTEAIYDLIKNLYTKIADATLGEFNEK